MRSARSIVVCMYVRLFPSQGFPREEWRRKLELERKRSLWQEGGKKELCRGCGVDRVGA